MYGSVLRKVGVAALVASAIVFADASPANEAGAVLQSKLFVEDVKLFEGDLQGEDPKAADASETKASETKASETKASETKASETKKASEKKSSDIVMADPPPDDEDPPLTDEELKMKAEGEKFEKHYNAEEDPDSADVSALLLQTRSTQLTQSETDVHDLDDVMDAKGPSINLHLGPISVGTSGVAVAPQLQFGVSGDGFDVTAGCGDIRSGLKCGVKAEINKVCHADGKSLQSFLRSAKCSGIWHKIPGHFEPISTAATIKAAVLKELGITIRSHVRVAGKFTLAQGVGVEAGVALGFWDDKDGYRMMGGGAAGIAGLKFSGELYVGLQRHGRKVKFVLGAGPVSIEAVVDTTRQDIRNSRKVNYVKRAPTLPGTSPHSSHNADGYKAVGWGEGRGRGGRFMPTQCKVGVDFTACVVRCNQVHHCVGFDSTVKQAGAYQRCCLRLSKNTWVWGWGHLHRGTENLAVTRGTCHASARNSCGIVMAKIPPDQACKLDKECPRDIPHRYPDHYYGANNRCFQWKWGGRSCNVDPKNDPYPHQRNDRPCRSPREVVLTRTCPPDMPHRYPDHYYGANNRCFERVWGGRSCNVDPKNDPYPHQRNDVQCKCTVR